MVLKVFAIFNRHSLKKYELNSTDHFCGVLYTGFMDKSVITKAIQKTKSGESMEILLHPCDFSGDCLGEYLENSRDYAVTYHRIDELKVLLDETLKNYINLNAKLITHRGSNVSSQIVSLQKNQNKKIDNKKIITVFIIFDETTFFHPNLLHKLINEVEGVNWVGALRVDLPRGGALQSYMLSKWNKLGIMNLLGLVLKTLVFKIIEFYQHILMVVFLLV